MSQELDDLLAAARESPASGAILRSLLRAAERAVDAAEAQAHLGVVGPAAFDGETRRLAARFLLDREEPADALAWLRADRPDPPTPDDDVAAARCLLDLDRREEAGEAYRAALGRDPTRRDPDLERRLEPVRMGQSGAVVDMTGRRLEEEEVRERVAAPSRPPVTFADVGGLQAVKDQIHRRIIRPFEHKALFQRFRRRAGGGVLLYGPPGCGKTLMARATAGECRAHFLSVAIPEILDMWLGESEKRLAAKFAEARTRRPAVLFFDEIEALAGRRRQVNQSAAASLVSTFLSEMDGVGAGNEGVLVLAATNVPWAIDPAFRRPGRFDRTVFVPPPDREARRSILALHLQDRPLARDVSLDDLAARTGSYSGADLADLVETAADLAIDDSLAGNEVAPIKAAHLREALKEAKPSTLEWLTTARNHAKFGNESGMLDEVVAFLDRHGR